jgi:hypothetical protein
MRQSRVHLRAISALFGLSAMIGCQLFVSTSIGKGLGETCESDDECQGSQCTGGLCTAKCAASSDCPSPLVCGATMTCALPPECVTNLDCIGAHGANWICRKKDQTCQDLITGDCKEVIGSDNLKAESTLLFSAIFALNGTNSTTGIEELAAVRMAYQDFQTSAGGLPPLPGESENRQMAVLVCDDSSDNTVALRSVQHVIDVGIQGIIGPTWSGPTLNFLPTAVGAGVLTLASGTTSPSFTTLAGKNGLFFRTAESMALEVPAIAGLSQAVEDAIVQARPGLAGNVKLALPYKGDAFGTGSKGALVPLLNINGKNVTDPANSQNFLQVDYGNPANVMTDPLKYDQTAAGIIALQPQIVIPIGTSEIFANVMGLVEAGWPTGASAPPRPYYIYPHTGVISALVTYLQSNPNVDPTQDLRSRIVGVIGGSNTSLFNQFRGNYTATQSTAGSPYQFFANTSYDAFYVFVYSAVSLGGQPLTGSNLAAGIANLVPVPNMTLTPIKVRPDDVGQALGLLSSGKKIDLEGTSGPLNFDLTTGDVAQENQVWCIPVDKNGMATFPPYTGYGYGLDGMPTGDAAAFKSAIQSTCGITIK